MDQKRATRTAATFGAALATLGVAAELHGDIIPLTFNPGTLPFGTGTFVTMPEISAGFGQFNDGAGKTIYQFDLDGVAAVSMSQMISPGTFTGFYSAPFSYSATGVQYVAFGYAGNVGWFSFDAGGPGGDITYLEGAYGSMGEQVHVGTIPAPAGLALLALGAVGIRRKRAA